MQAIVVAGLFNWGGRKAVAAAPVASAASADPSTKSKVLPKFLTALAPRPAPLLMDLGPVVGSNISFFGDHLSCKIFVEDLYAQVASAVTAGTVAALPAAFATRLHRGPDSVDGIICWDLFDYLDRPTGQALAKILVRQLRSGGALYGFFGNSTTDVSHYTRFIVDSPDTLRLKTTPAATTKRTVWVTRDVGKLFDGLSVAESVLLKNNTREFLFRKP